MKDRGQAMLRNLDFVLEAQESYLSFRLETEMIPTCWPEGCWPKERRSDRQDLYNSLGKKEGELARWAHVEEMS